MTPWRSLNARLQAPDGLQLTLFTELPQVGQDYDGQPDGQLGDPCPQTAENRRA